MEKAKVYLTSILEPQSLVKLYEKLGVKQPGKVAENLHSGEDGNKNYLKLDI